MISIDADIIRFNNFTDKISIDIYTHNLSISTIIPLDLQTKTVY